MLADLPRQVIVICNPPASPKFLISRHPNAPAIRSLLLILINLPLHDSRIISLAIHPFQCLIIRPLHLRINSRLICRRTLPHISPSALLPYPPLIVLRAPYRVIMCRKDARMTSIPLLHLMIIDVVLAQSDGNQRIGHRNERKHNGDAVSRFG